MTSVRDQPASLETRPDDPLEWTADQARKLFADAVGTEQVRELTDRIWKVVEPLVPPEVRGRFFEKFPGKLLAFVNAREGTTLEPYFRTSIRHALFDDARAERRHQRGRSEGGDVAGPVGSPEDWAIARETVRLAATCFRHLRARHETWYQVLRLRVSGLLPSDVVAVLRIPPGTEAVFCKRARRFMSECLRSKGAM
jgi:DNA-directed RNA polymerase specialized sigma24 family protein